MHTLTSRFISREGTAKDPYLCGHLVMEAVRTTVTVMGTLPAPTPSLWGLLQSTTTSPGMLRGAPLHWLSHTAVVVDQRKRL